MDNNAQPTTATVVFAPGCPFLKPYFEREFANDLLIYVDDNSISADKVRDAIAASGFDISSTRAIMVSSTDIYNVSGGTAHDESTPLLPGSEWAAREEEFTHMAEAGKYASTILRAAHIVGTGMNGLPMRLARGIARGMLMHIRGNEAMLSVVHASDVARLAVILPAGLPPLNITDGTETRVDDLIDALAYRMKNKRVYTIKSQRIARLLYGGEYFGELTNTLTFSNAALLAALPAGTPPPEEVTNYLRTHVYDESSL